MSDVSASKVREANLAFHERQADTYDDGHRATHIDEWVLREFVDADARVLDLASGTGLAASLVESDDVVCTDLVEEMLEHNDEGVCVQAPASDLPFTSDEFDAVIVRSALHHFPDLEAVMAEVSRVMRPGGVFVATHEPVGYRPLVYWTQRARGALGHLLGRTEGWKADLADEFGTDPVALGQLVNIWERDGVPVDVLDDALDRRSYVEYSIEWVNGSDRFYYVGENP